MIFNPPFISAALIKRYKRFLADVRLADGTEITAHCPNPGAMLGSRDPGMRVALSHSDNPKRKLPYTLEMVHNGETWIGVNTMRANQVVFEALSNRQIPALGDYQQIKTEVKYGEKSRIDFLLNGPQGQTYLEVKSVTLRLAGDCAFPDAVTTRGRRHLEELSAMRRAGHRAVMLFLVQRADGSGFRPAPEDDPAYCLALRQAHAEGVEILVYRAKLAPDRWELGEPIDWQV